MGVQGFRGSRGLPGPAVSYSPSVLTQCVQKFALHLTIESVFVKVKK